MMTPVRTPLPTSEGQPSPQAEGRRLIHLPIIHTQADMGALSSAIKEMTIQKLGQQGWERNVHLIDEIWTRIEEAIDSWALPCERVRLYQDGLPVCGREAGDRHGVGQGGQPQPPVAASIAGAWGEPHGDRIGRLAGAGV